MRYGSLVLGFVLILSLSVHAETSCPDFAICVKALYDTICSDPANTPASQQRCSSDWRTQWMALESHCQIGANANGNVCTEWKKLEASRLSFRHRGRKPHWEASGAVAKRTKFD